MMQTRKHILIGAYLTGVIAGGMFYYRQIAELRTVSGKWVGTDGTHRVEADSEDSTKERIREMSVNNPLVRFPQLQDALGHPSSTIRYQALLAMKYDVSPEAIAFLHDRAIHDPSPDIRDLALQQAVQKQPDRALSLVITALGDESQSVRDTAMMKLAEIAPPDLTNRIMGWCEAENRDPRRGEILALGKVGGDRAIEFLISVVLRHASVSGIAIHTLAQQGDAILPFIDRLEPGKLDDEQILYICLLLEEIRSEDACVRIDRWRGFQARGIPVSPETHGSARKKESAAP